MQKKSTTFSKKMAILGTIFYWIAVGVSLISGQNLLVPTPTIFLGNVWADGWSFTAYAVVVIVCGVLNTIGVFQIDKKLGWVFKIYYLILGWIIYNIYEISALLVLFYPSALPLLIYGSWMLAFLFFLLVFTLGIAPPFSGLLKELKERLERKRQKYFN